MNCSIALDKTLADRWYPLEPKFNIYQLTKPFEVDSQVAIPKPVIASISNWLEG